MTSIAIYNNKGGCGKSTNVINLAYHFSLDSKVLVIDTDGQSNTSRFFLDEPKSGLDKVLLGEIEAIRGEKTRYTNLDVISATAAINGVESTFSGFSEKKQRELADRLVNANSDYDYIFIDLPPTMNDLTGQIIGACDYVFVPVELGIFSIQGIPKVTERILNFSRCFQVSLAARRLIRPFLTARLSKTQSHIRLPLKNIWAGTARARRSECLRRRSEKGLVGNG